jgi:hypothetical protein
MSTDLSLWYYAQHKNAVGLDKIKVEGKIKQFFDRFPQSYKLPNGQDEWYEMTGRYLMGSFINRKAIYSFGVNGYATITLTVTNEDLDSNYAYIYWNLKDMKTPEFICISPTYDSRDGEFRGRLIKYTLFDEIYHDNSKVFEKYESIVIKLISDGIITLDVRVFTHLADYSEISKFIESNRIIIIAFIFALIADVNDIVVGIAMGHINNRYSEIMKRIYSTNEIFSSKQYTEDKKSIHALHNPSSNRYRGVTQKITPLYLRETMQPFDINLSGWRELLVTQAVSNLVINYISPNFPLHISWMYIEGSNSLLFENLSMKEKYNRSNIIEQSVQYLRQARSYNSEQVLIPSYHSDEYYAGIYEDIEYAQSFLLMSSYALLNASTYAGYSLYSYPSYIEYSTLSPLEFNVFENFDNSMKILFDYIFAVYCLHNKLGVIHSDLHSNNILISQSSYLIHSIKNSEGETINHRTYTNPKVIYVVNTDNIFVLPTIGYSGTIIDFSRCLIGAKFGKLTSGSNTETNYKFFYKNQINRIVKTLHKFIPSFVKKYEIKIKSLLLSEYDKIFPIICLIDYISIAKSFQFVINEKNKEKNKEKTNNEFQFPKELLDVTKSMEDTVYQILIDNFKNVVENVSTISDFSTLPIQIFNKFFGKWNINNISKDELKDSQPVDAYNFENDIKYRGENYQDWPRWAKIDEIERHLGEYKIQDLIPNLENFIDSLNPNNRIDYISEKNVAEQEKIDGKPVHMMSSQLDD